MGKIDRYLGKWSSRKLMVLLIATVLVSFGRLDSGDWSNIAMAYIFAQGLVDIKEFLKK